MSQSEVELEEVVIPPLLDGEIKRLRGRHTAMRFALQFHSDDPKAASYDLVNTAEQIYKFLNKPPDDVPVPKPTVADEEPF